MAKILDTFQLGFPWQTLDPFLFCAYHNDKFPEGNEQFGPNESLQGRNIGQDFAFKDGWNMYHGDKVPGFPAHPHRGFETITVVNSGLVDHADSMGAAGRYGEGDTQWMTAGRGVQHSEMFPLTKQDDKNPLELFQIWLNLPAKNKMVEPHFAMIWNEDAPLVSVKDDESRESIVKVIAGEFQGEAPSDPPPDSWASNKANEVAVWNIKMTPGATMTLPKASPGLNRVLYFYEGESLQLEDTRVNELTGIRLASDEEIKLTNGNSDGCILILQGKPINEPVAQYGPFVMNTQMEIQQAMMDYRRDQFGGWPWDRHDQIHTQYKGRFAKHADGKVEEKAL